jgi:hypothetical protein
VSDGDDSGHGSDGRTDAVADLVGEQLRTARAEVFRAYLQSRDKARALLDDEDDARRRAVEQRFERRRPS